MIYDMLIFFVSLQSICNFLLCHMLHMLFFLFMIHVTNDMIYIFTFAYDYECNMCVQVLISLLR